jgi:hypothetical protein
MQTAPYIQKAYELLHGKHKHIKKKLAVVKFITGLNQYGHKFEI